MINDKEEMKLAFHSVSDTADSPFKLSDFDCHKPQPTKAQQLAQVLWDRIHTALYHSILFTLNQNGKIRNIINWSKNSLLVCNLIEFKNYC